MGIVPLKMREIRAALLEAGGMTMPKRTPPRIVAAKNSQMSLFRHCPKCSRLLRTAPLCGRCNLLVHRSNGFDVATHEEGPEATLQEIRDFLHPPDPKTLADVADEYCLERARQLGKPVILGDDTTIVNDSTGRPVIIHRAPLPTSKPSGQLAKYEPRRLAHERKASPWLWRTVYAVITMTAAAFTLWQALRVG